MPAENVPSKTSVPSEIGAPSEIRITTDDIRAKSQQVLDTVKQTQETAKTGAAWTAIGLAGFILVVFLLGRRRGRAGGAVVEVYKV